jgi:PAS domain S-box-containing protein
MTQSGGLKFLAGGGEMGARIRAYDWAATPLGQPEHWPLELRFALSICLDSSVPTSIYWGPDLRLIYNDAWAPIPAEKHPWALGRPAREVWPDIWDVIGPQFAQVLEHGEGFSAFDIMLPMQRGGRVVETYWNYSFTPIRDEAGKVIGVLNQGHETTRQVKARRERDEQIDLLREMFEQAPGAVALLRGPMHVFELTNAAYQELVGRHALVGEAVAAALPEAGEQGFVALLDEVYATGTPYVGRDIAVRVRRGTRFAERLLDFIFQPVRGNHGEVSGIFIQATDVTDRARAVAALREGEERFRLVAESAPVMLWMGDATGKCIYLNRAQREFWGVAPAQVSHFDWSTALHPEDQQKLFEPLRRAMEEHTSLTVEARFRRSDGVYRVLQTRAEPRFGPQGEFVGMIGVNADITDAHRAQKAQQALTLTLEQRVAEEVSRRAQAEAVLQQMQKMEAIGQLTGGIAHDFNNMLAVVIGGLNLLRRRLAQGETDVSRYIDGALDGAQRAASLTQRLLAFARQQPLALETIDVNRMLADTIELLARTLGETILIQTLPAADLWPVCTDRNQLESTLLNLAVNARDAMKSGGRLAIETANVTLADTNELAVAPGDYVLIRVADTGTGMTPEVMARAFDPFFTTKPLGEGTGLGLSQVFGFVRQSDGQIRIHSEVGRGTAVSIYLPRFAGEMREREPRTTNVIRRGRADEVVMVVEDEPRVRAFSTEALRELGYGVVSAASGDEALQMIEAGQPVTVLFTDIVMPGMTGRELARRASSLLPDLSVVFTSGYSRDVSGRSEDAVDILAKPFSIEQLASRMREALHRSDD